MAPNEPNAWTSYLLVTDVDAAIITATIINNTMLVRATNIHAGRFTILASPSGAVFGLWQSAKVGPKPSGKGSVHWVELNTTDMDADVAWLTATFEYTTRESKGPRGRYVELLNNGEPWGGVVGALPGAPAHWLSWVQVDELDNTLSRVDAGGRKGHECGHREPKHWTHGCGQ
jgi:predicted enzyme related to lactoylglutathione lyase